MNRTGNVFEWAIRGGQHEDDDQSMGPEDYAWYAASHFGSRPGQVPNLEWVWDVSARDLMAYQITVALRQPLGSA